MKYIGFISLFALLVSISCVPNERLIYLQNLENQPQIAEDSLIFYALDEYRLQYNDIIDVKIQTNSEEMNELFNIKQQQMQGSQQLIGGGDIYYMTGYTVDRNGQIDLPLIGNLKVSNKTLAETKLAIIEKLSRFIVSNEFFVRVKLGGIRYSALGDVRRPGKYVVLQDRMTIFEAIANAGDLSTTAKRDEILLIRQYPEGTKLHRVNLLDRNIVHTPFYFIQPNDQIYAEPMKIREVGAGENVAQSLQLFVTSITAAALILNLVLR
ncbi:polysaccharide biosynthesis/export family protein [Lunatibacter salilacus]|uniref:polysaccharide biosynthesis/export family protein n=1 Tax=Lunatibacter salilacus TaxID=2483804 RepID=UPI00131D5F1E|nr:polysaccharide biosynthesis/export family protein [Lunatibacter salilacus]